MTTATTHRRVILLGPQREHPSVDAAVETVAPTGRVATVTAGWEEREGEDKELIEHLSRTTINLGLFPRTEDVFAKDPELFAAMQARNDLLRRQRELYGLRLSAALGVAHHIMAQSVVPGAAIAKQDALLEREIESAIESVRALDRHHFLAVREIHDEFDESWKPVERDAVAQHRGELADQLADCNVLCIAGGHVGILLNRLRLFDVLGLVPDLPIVAWAGGGMVLAKRIVLFHDSPPQGAGDAEVFEEGLGVFDQIVPLPHASQRMKLDDSVRVSLFARRFAPAICPALDPGNRIDWEADGWHGPNTRALSPDGTLAPFDSLSQGMKAHA